MGVKLLTTIGGRDGCKERSGLIIEANGLYGMMDYDGNILAPAEYILITKTNDFVFFLKENGEYRKVFDHSIKSGTFAENERPFVVNNKAGFKIDGKVIIPADYDYIELVWENDSYYYAEKDGEAFYFNKDGQRVLTRVRDFVKETKIKPFCDSYESLDMVTSHRYVGHPVKDNDNVIKIWGKWVELDHYNKDEVMKLLINPDDDLALTEEDLKYLLSDDACGISLHIAQASGENRLQQCIEQMRRRFDDCLAVKITQAPGEYLDAQELRYFRKNFFFNYCAIGHDARLKKGEVEMAVVAYDNRFLDHLDDWQYEGVRGWRDEVFGRDKMPSIKKYYKLFPKMKEDIEHFYTNNEYTDALYQDQLWRSLFWLDFSGSTRYSWKEVVPYLEKFVAKGASADGLVDWYLYNASQAAGRISRYNEWFKDHEKMWKKELKSYQKCLDKAKKEFKLYLQAARWALKYDHRLCFHHEPEDEYDHKTNSLDAIRSIAYDVCKHDKPIIQEIESKLLEAGLKPHAEFQRELEENTGYFKELHYWQHLWW